jgi:hypothetical protein
MTPKLVPSSVYKATQSFRDKGKPFALVILLDSMLYVEATAKTAVAFEKALKAWSAETLPTLYRSNVRVFICSPTIVKEVTLSKSKTLKR